jgi:lipopolysaccharide heptosyltransferase II
MMTDWKNHKNLLCIRLDNMGDLLMTIPAFHALKESIPEARITLLSSPVGSEAAPLIPFVDDCIVYEAPWMKATEHHDISQTNSVINLLRERHFDGAIIFNVFSQNPLPAAFLCYLAEIPQRLGYCRENPYHLLTDWIKDPEVTQPVRHEVQRQLDLVSFIGCSVLDQRLRLNIPNDVHGKIKKLLGERQINLRKKLMVVHPGASAPSRRYPTQHFIKVVNELTKDFDIVFTGSKEEGRLIKCIQANTKERTYSLAGLLSFAELSSFISMAAMLITNNTGPAHIAAAVGTPVVDLYALTNPQHTPWMVPHRVLYHDVPCKFCYKSICPNIHHDCLQKLKPEEVVSAVKDLLEHPLINHQESERLLCIS